MKRQWPAWVTLVFGLVAMGGRSHLAAQIPAKAVDPKVVYTALNPLLEFQRRFFERRMIDPTFVARFNTLVRQGDLPGAAALVAQTIGVTGATVVVSAAAGAPGAGSSGVPVARICFDAAIAKICSEWQ